MLEGQLPSGRLQNYNSNVKVAANKNKNFEACFNNYEGLNSGKDDNNNLLLENKVCNTEINHHKDSDNITKPSTSLGKSDFSDDFRLIRQKLLQKKAQNQEGKNGSIKDQNNLTTSANRLTTNTSQTKQIKNSTISISGGGRPDIKKQISLTVSVNKTGNKSNANYQSLKAASNKNTISSIGNAKASSTLKNRKIESTSGNASKISNLITSPKPFPTPLHSKKDSNCGKSNAIPTANKGSSIAGFNKLVMNNNEFLKKQQNYFSEPNATDSLKFEPTKNSPSIQKHKIEECQINKNIFSEGILKETDFSNPKITHSRKSSLDGKNSSIKQNEDNSNKELSSTPQITSNSQNNFKSKQACGANISSNFKNILQNSKINVIKHSQILKTSANSKAVTPKPPSDDKHLVNQTSRKSLTGNCKSASKKAYTSCGAPIHNQQSTSNQQSNIEVNFVVDSKMKFTATPNQLRPNSKMAEKISKAEGSVILKKVAQTENNSPRHVTKRTSANKIGLNNNDSTTKYKGKDDKNEDKSNLLANNKHFENNSYMDKDEHSSNTFQKESDLLIEFVRNCKYIP